MLVEPSAVNSTRETILARLATERHPVSGHLLAEELGISRTAVWKHVRHLREHGINIRTISGRGYLLQSDTFNAAAVAARLSENPPKRIGRQVLVFEQLDSTNAEAMRQADQGVDEGLVVFANHQQQGRGRMGRKWHTMAEDALAMSILLRPELPPESVPQLSLVTAVGLHQALSSIASDVCIKWPNDLLHHNAKLAGILTEMRAEPGHVHAVVVGVGVNIRHPASGWPADIAQPVTDLSTAAGEYVSRLDTAVQIIRHLGSAYQNYLENGFGPIRKAWWQAHTACNQQVRVHDGGHYISGVAEALDEDGALLLRTREGLTRIIAGDLEVMNAGDGSS